MLELKKWVLHIYYAQPYCKLLDIMKRVVISILYIQFKVGTITTCLEALYVDAEEKKIPVK